MIKIFTVVFSFVASISVLYAQWEDLSFEDEIYQPTIHSVQFHLTGFPMTPPVIDLGSSGTLTLRFDDLGDDIADKYYTLIHCDSDWQPSDLNPLEYLNGFEENDLRALDFSFNTLTEYTHFQLQLPNQDVTWTKSGNYLLVVYEDEDTPILTRRLMVVEPLVKIFPQMVRPPNTQKAWTHHEIDFNVNIQQLPVRDPRQELTATILQNGRWDNAITDVPPFLIRPDEVIYDYQDKICFPAGKEFRFIDLRSFRARNEGIAALEEYEDLYEVTLYTDPQRGNAAYQFIRDINGGFTIENIHEPNNNLQSDYGLVLFSLESNQPFYEGDVYLFGKMTDWKIRDEFKMAYSEKLGLYAVDVLLKQGFYDYSYVLVPHGTATANWEETEGNWHETENEYTILIYFRPFGERYDRLVGSASFTSISK